MYIDIKGRDRKEPFKVCDNVNDEIGKKYEETEKVDVTIWDETDIGTDGTCLARTLRKADKAMFIISARAPQSNLEISACIYIYNKHNFQKSVCFIDVKIISQCQMLLSSCIKFQK